MKNVCVCVCETNELVSRAPCSQEGDGLTSICDHFSKGALNSRPWKASQELH